MAERRPLVAVFGSSTTREGQTPYTLAYDLGAALARAGADVLTGGYSGVMEACSRGASEHGGHVVGVTVNLFEQRSSVNRWVKERVHTEHLYDRLRVCVERADGFVVAPGSLGTLNELFLTWTLLSVSARPEAPLVLLGAHWPAMLDTLRNAGGIPEPLYRFVQVSSGAEDAARRVMSGIPASRGSA